MRSVSYRLSDLETIKAIPIGFEGENLYTHINIDCKKVFDEDNQFVPTLCITAPSGEKYPGIVTRNGDIVTWEVSASDLITKGSGEIQLAFTHGNVVGKTWVARTRIERSIVPTGDVPTEIENFIIEAGTIVNGIPQAIDDALAEAKASGEFDGFSPVITVTAITGGHRVSVTDAEGTTTFDVMDGEKGDTGSKGDTGATGNGIASVVLNQDYTLTINYTDGTSTTTASIRGEKGETGSKGDTGFSPYITVVDITNGHRVTVTNQSGSTSFDVMNGAKGDPGTPGDPTALIDDTTPAANKTFSSSKIDSELSAVKSQIGVSQPTAQNSDIGKFLKLKTIDQNGKPTAFEYGEGGGSSGDYVEKNGTDQVVPKNMSIMEKTYSPNMIDETKLTLGKYIAKNGVLYDGNYNTTDYIPVEVGEKYTGSNYYNNTNRYDSEHSWFAFFNSDKTVNTSASSSINKLTSPFEIPSGVSYIRISFTNSSSYTKWMLEKGETKTTYYPYGEVLGAVVKNEYLPDEPVSMDDIPAFHLVDGQNLLNQNDPDFGVGFLNINGTIDTSYTGYRTSGYIAVSENDRLMGSYVSGAGGTGYIGLRTVAAYNASKTNINASGAYSLDSLDGYLVPEGVSFVRICYHYGTYGDNVQICITHSNRIKPYAPYETPHYELKENYLALSPSEPEHVYLPEEIYVAVGRTIELYNEQVVLDYQKYYFRWQCAKGKADKRKFSITGVTTGDISLALILYDDKMNICWIGGCTIHVVAASNPVKKILPIGDSLTRGKAWLPEVLLLGSGNITWIGTRYTNSLKDSENNTYAKINHEGRSGWSAGNYLTDSVYDQDTAYDGVPGVDGSANPFWDGSKFSLEHYLTVQTGVDTPDAVQIFLGTNDLTVSTQTAISNIVEIVESIRDEYANLPIFVCNTIYRSNQNGYGSVGNDAYAGAGSGANAFQYQQDIRVMDLMEGLRNELRSKTGVYLVPLATCMDREYDFGQVMTKVNPRSTVEVPMPSESVHPQAVGYYQMADLMYSFYCGVLS